MESISILVIKREFWYIPPLFDQLFVSRDTVSFFLKFYLSIWNFLISGNFLKSGVCVWKHHQTHRVCVCVCVCVCLRVCVCAYIAHDTSFIVFTISTMCNLPLSSFNMHIEEKMNCISWAYINVHNYTYVVKQIRIPLLHGHISWPRNVWKSIMKIWRIGACHCLPHPFMWDLLDSLPWVLWWEGGLRPIPVTWSHMILAILMPSWKPRMTLCVCFPL